MTWTPDQPIITIKDVRKSFGTLEVLKGVSLDVLKGEVICIIGPSGSDYGVKSLLILFNSPAIFRSPSISSRSRPIVLETVQ